jgi:NAD(P)-dependent dehydrogenase (short-subunit alcohol dehydrogenase family)
MTTKKGICVVAGIGPGNGAAFARRFALAGYRVALLARSSTTSAPLEKELAGSKAYAVDLTSPEAVQATFASIERDLGPADVLIHNAGAFARSAFLETKPEDFEAVWRGGPWSLLLCGQQAARQMLGHGGGAIVAIGATASLRGAESFAALGSSKAAHRSLAQSMARGLGPRGIHVSYVVIDGVVDAPRTRQFLPDKPDDFFVKPGAVAETVFQITRQDRSAWTFELDLRTSTEKW